MFYTSDLFGFSALEDWLANIVEEKNPQTSVTHLESW